MARVLELGLVVVALAVAGWFGLGWIQARDTSRADALIAGSGAVSAADGTRAASLLNSAGTLNPDRTVDLLRANLAADRHHYARAVKILTSITRSEPQNVLAWEQLAVVAGLTHNHSLVTTAGRHIAQLVPNLG